MKKVKVGDEIPDWHMPCVSATRMRTMAAILRDPNPVHWDSDLVESFGMGKRTINQGPLGLSYIINMLHQWMGPHCLKRIFMRFPKAVFSDDEVIAGGVIKETQEKNDQEFAICEVWLKRDGEVLLSGEATVLIEG
ncbi:MAG: acyl dehydratase [Flavobacterium sp.]|jgi:acyl dehydratase